MVNSHVLKGVIPAMLTPTYRQRVEHSVLEEYTYWLMNEGVDGLFLLGTTGEGLLVSDDDWDLAVSTVVRTAAGRIPVAVQCGGLTLQQTINRVTRAVRAGANVVALLTPYFYTYSDSVLETYFTEIVSAWPNVPFYLYNIPKYANNEISVEVFRKLAERHDNVCGVKDSSGSIEQLQAYRTAAPDRDVLTGSDAIVQQSYEQGATGIVSGLAAVFPAAAVSAWRQLHEGDASGAKKMKAICDVFHKFSTITAGRAVLSHNGIPIGEPLKPMQPLTQEHKEQLFHSLRMIDPHLLR
jgi:dihydrodipicolinate synthase/N-acetylneuraminate lyase